MSVLVYAEQVLGKFKKATAELVSYAYVIAKEVKTEVIVVTVGSAADLELMELKYYGAVKIIRIRNEALEGASAQAYCLAIAEVVDKVSAEYVLFQNNSNGHAIAPRLSVKLKAGLVTGAFSVPINYLPCVLKKKVFSGKATAHVQINTNKKIICLNPNSFSTQENKVECTLVDYAVSLPDAVFAMKVTEVNRDIEKVPVTEAICLVSGGRGMQGLEHWSMLEGLAESLSASLSCSKPVSDLGWRPHEEHVGQTGKSVSPNLYVAVGISGAIQHMAGVNSSKVIVAINNDPEASIFNDADYGIVGDAFKILPELTKAILDLKR